MSTGKACVLVEPNRIETWEVPIVDPEAGGALVRIVERAPAGLEYKPEEAGA